MTARALDYTETRAKDRPKCDACGDRVRLCVVLSGRAASLRICDCCLDEAVMAAAGAGAWGSLARDEPATDLDVMDLGPERG